METLGNLKGIGLLSCSTIYCHRLGKKKGIPGGWAYGAGLGPLGVAWCLAKEDKSKKGK